MKREAITREARRDEKGIGGERSEKSWAQKQ